MKIGVFSSGSMFDICRLSVARHFDVNPALLPSVVLPTNVWAGQVHTLKLAVLPILKLIIVAFRAMCSLRIKIT